VNHVQFSVINLIDIMVPLWKSWRYQNHKSKERQYNGQKDKQWSTKRYTENWRLSNTNTIITRMWIQV